jgi:hypothetical protein
MLQRSMNTNLGARLQRPGDGSRAVLANYFQNTRFLFPPQGCARERNISLRATNDIMFLLTCGTDEYLCLRQYGTCLALQDMEYEI